MFQIVNNLFHKQRPSISGQDMRTVETELLRDRMIHTPDWSMGVLFAAPVQPAGCFVFLKFLLPIALTMTSLALISSLHFATKLLKALYFPGNSVSIINSPILSRFRVHPTREPIRCQCDDHVLLSWTNHQPPDLVSSGRQRSPFLVTEQ